MFTVRIRSPRRDKCKNFPSESGCFVTMVLVLISTIQRILGSMRLLIVIYIIKRTSAYLLINSIIKKYIIRSHTIRYLAGMFVGTYIN